jgi:DNA-binding LacI/PurR family transcriptional regulator
MAVQPNLRDVADRAGVSVRTVSNVVNDFVHVAPRTRERVQRAIDELGYRPNLAARQLRRGRSEVVSVVLPEIDSPYFGELAAILVRIGEQRGWSMHIEQTDGDGARERQMLDGMHGQGVDGVVFSPWAMTPSELTRRASAPPVVMLGERGGPGPIDHVAVDNVAAADEATVHLLGLGRRRIAAVGLQPQLSNETARQRQRGYRQALRRAGVDLDERLEVQVERLHRPDGARAMADLLDADRPVDAVFCFTDQLALGAMRTLADRGLTVPGDVAVVGFDDIEDGRYSVPSLTTIAPDKHQLAATALQCLADRMIDRGLPGRELVVEHRLVVRDSSGAAGTSMANPAR